MICTVEYLRQINEIVKFTLFFLLSCVTLNCTGYISISFLIQIKCNVFLFLSLLLSSSLFSVPTFT